MCKELCEDPEEQASCQDCGRLICFDMIGFDDIMRPACVTSSGDLYCDRCAAAHDRAEEEEFDEYGDWDEHDYPIPCDEDEP